MTTASRRALRLQTLRDPWRRRYALRRRVMLAAYAVLARPSAARRASDAFERIGSGYGGWTIPAGVVERGWTCVCAGAGIDISFDLGLISRYGCRVVTVDPTDESRDVVARDAAGVPQLRFVQAALWSCDGELTMFTARDPTHQTLSADDLQDTGAATTVPCVSLAGLGEERIDLVKLDVEGAEYAIAPTILRSVRVLCIEWHPTRPLREMVRTYRSLLDAGFRLAARTGADHTFVRD